MLKISNPGTVAPPVGAYSHSVEIPPNARWLYLSGTIGVDENGNTPDGFEAQHEQIWRNTLKLLEHAGMGPEDIVRLNVYTTDASGIRFLRPHREKYIGQRPMPASTWVVVSQLAQPQWVVEMETVAAKV